MKTINCMAIDDEPLALNIIRRYCERHGNMNLRTYTNPEEAIPAIRDVNPDILFLDIQMKEISGLEIAAGLTSQMGIVFTTAHPEFALEGFNLDAVDYLHKPFSYERFMQAVNKALRRMEHRTEAAGKFVIVKQDYSNVRIPLESIAYIEAMEGYVKIFRYDARRVIARMVLKKMFEMLPSGDFVRIHRSYVVPLGGISGFSRSYVTLTDGTRLPVGRSYAADVAKALHDVCSIGSAVTACNDEE